MNKKAIAACSITLLIGGGIVFGNSSLITNALTSENPKVNLTTLNTNSIESSNKPKTENSINVVTTLPSNNEISKENAIELSKKEIIEKYNLSEDSLNSLVCEANYYSDDPIIGPTWGVAIMNKEYYEATQNMREIRTEEAKKAYISELNSKNSIYYYVIIDSKTGEILNSSSKDDAVTKSTAPIPTENDINEENALEIGKNAVMQKYSLTQDDINKLEIKAIYENNLTKIGSVWYVELKSDSDYYWVIMASSNGEVKSVTHNGVK